MQEFFTKKPCTQGIVSVAQALNLTNYFNPAYMANIPDSVCNQLNDAADFRLAVKRALILCDTDENPSMFGMINLLFGYENLEKGEEMEARQIFRKSQCRYNYTFQITSAAKSNAPGGTVTITYAPQSHYVNGTATLGQPGFLITLPGSLKSAYIVSKNTNVAYGHTAVIAPNDANYIINIPAGATLIPTMVRAVGDITSQQPGANVPVPGKIAGAYISRIRGDWQLDKVLNKGYDGVLQFALAYMDGKEVECWQPLLVTELRRGMRMTKDRMLLLGEKNTNPIVTSNIQSIQGFDGYYSSIKYAGGHVINFNSADGFDPQLILGAIFRFANANKRSKEYFMFLSRDFKLTITNALYQWIGNNPGGCTFQAFSRMVSNYGKAGSTAQNLVEYLNIDSWKIDGYTVHFFELQEFSDPTLYGAAGYGFDTRAFVMPADKIKTSDNKSVAPIEIFFPSGCSDTGSYQEWAYDCENQIGGNDRIEGHATEEFTALFHCLEDHNLIEDTNCN